YQYTEYRKKSQHLFTKYFSKSLNHSHSNGFNHRKKLRSTPVTPLSHSSELSAPPSAPPPSDNGEVVFVGLD
ncbi:hypothetical protein, partial [Synechocystis sp. FACHB-898]|uniref:hypothetical protein n=1 Tax=Synechocystis sp. FACHB-898 TaxID=2692865 RepID=UPI001A7EC79B